MKKLLFLFLLIFFVNTSINGELRDRYVVIVSLDGFRWDYSEWYDTPLLDSLAKKGVKSGLIPCFPSKTFPNHYSLATGLVPDHHGIIANSFLERKTNTVFSIGNKKTKSISRFWGGEPIWLTAKKQGCKSAVFYWPGSDVAIQGELPDIYHLYDSSNRIPLEERFDSMLVAMNKGENERPRLIMGYLEEPDYSGHTYGPQDKRTKKAVEGLDSLLMHLYSGLMALPYAEKIDFLVVSDHGMAVVNKENQIPLMSHIKEEWVERIEGDMPANIYVKPGHQDEVFNALKDIHHLSVWKKGEIPEDLCYGTNENCGDVIVSPDLGYIATDKVFSEGGKHGFDPGFNDMHALFRAVGPDFKNCEIKHFRNTSVYLLICRLLGLQPADNDGCYKDVESMLK